MTASKILRRALVNIDVDSFHFVERDAADPDAPHSEGPFKMFIDLYDGLVNAADLIFLIFIGCWVAIILTETGAFTGFINAAKNALKTKTAILIPGLSQFMLLTVSREKWKVFIL